MVDSPELISCHEQRHTVGARDSTTVTEPSDHSVGLSDRAGADNATAVHLAHPGQRAARCVEFDALAH